MKGIGYKRELEFKNASKGFPEIDKIIKDLRALEDEYLVVELIDYSEPLDFIQTVRMDGSDLFLIEIALKTEKIKPQIFQLKNVSQNDCLRYFRDVCVDAKLPNLTKWKDITIDTFYRRIAMNIFKKSYKIVRENSTEIYKGFGFRHLSDATQYYVHPDNQSVDGSTTLCQPIGESVILFTIMLRAIAAGKPFGDFFVSDEKNKVFLDFKVPEEYRVSGVVGRQIYRYRALSEEMKLKVAAYNEEDIFIEGDLEDLTLLYKLLPAFMVLLGRETDSNLEYRATMERFMENPVADLFVNLHEDFYQNHKMDEHELEYADVKATETVGWHSWADSYAVIRENKAEAAKNSEVKIRTFSEDAFTEEQRALIPHLSAEFVLPENLESVCNAVAAGDLMSILFHGPAGTGKTISCKLVAQSIELPIMETINCTENLDEFVLGKYIPQDDKIIFKESYVTRAIREGGAVVFEEINFAKPQYLAFLNSLLDDNGFVRLDNGEVVKRHPNFRFFATMNMGYLGTRDLNQALFNRFNAVIEVAALSDEAIIRMLTARVPECAPLVEKMLGVYHKLKKKVESEELDVVISPRNLENWAKLAKYEGYMKAAEKTLIPIAKGDRTLEDTIRGMMMLYKWRV